MKNSDRKKFCAKSFVNDLLEEGDRVYCDENFYGFNRGEKLPKYYDEEKFKRGQRFYHKNIMAMFFAKLLGLVMSLALPKVNKILMMTGKSYDSSTAYRRYLSTIFHMCVWYDENFRPNSDLWKSISSVKCKHNNASRNSSALGFGHITQKDMALAQFSFMALVLIRPRKVGIHEAREENVEAFVHLWRVIGYLFGMDERFNICRDSLSETREICELLLKDVFQPEVVKKDPAFLQMSTALMEGMWCMNPVVEINVFLAYIFEVLDVSMEMNLAKKIHLLLVKFVIEFMLRFSLLRYLMNQNHYLALWLMRNYPFLAYYKFDQKTAHVNSFYRKL